MVRVFHRHVLGLSRAAKTGDFRIGIPECSTAGIYVPVDSWLT